MKRIIISLLSVLAAAFPAAAQADWCGASDEQNWQEFASLYGAATSASAGRPVVYTLAAPWCPYCAEMFRNLQTRRYSFDVKFIPSHSKLDRDHVKIADMVVDGGLKSLVRVYTQRVASDAGFSRQQMQFIERVQVAADLALMFRFNEKPQNWGTPISFFYSSNGRIRMVVGQPNLDEIDRLVSRGRNEAPPPDLRRFITTGVPKTEPIAGQPVAVRDNVRMRILPDERAFSVMCLSARQPLTSTSAIRFEGKTWLVFSAPYDPAWQVQFYARGEDFTGWRLK